MPGVRYQVQRENPTTGRREIILGRADHRAAADAFRHLQECDLLDGVGNVEYLVKVKEVEVSEESDCPDKEGQFQVLRMNPQRRIWEIVNTYRNVGDAIRRCRQSQAADSEEGCHVARYRVLEVLSVLSDSEPPLNVDLDAPYRFGPTRKRRPGGSRTQRNR